MWVSFDDGDHWQSLQLNLPHTSMRDLWIHGDDLIVATHGRVVLDSGRHRAAARRLGDRLASSAHSVQARAGVSRAARHEYRHAAAAGRAGRRESAGRRDHRLLPAGARRGPVTLEIIDAQGKLVRRYASTDKPEITRRGTGEAADSAVLGARAARRSPTDAGHASLGVGSALRYADHRRRHEYPIAASAARHSAVSAGANSRCRAATPCGSPWTANVLLRR